jgi:exopolyphosphatase/guanosine-5'-triphosphate,3'-diphosphate pyrophosphatase
VSGPGAGSAEKAGSVRVGAIDIGTNTVLLLVAERREGELVAVRERATITRLGEGVDHTRELAPGARQRTLACLADYARTLHELGVTRVECVGTSAMRDARGGPEFAHEVAAVLGRAPRILSGAEEAVLTFGGALSGLTLTGAVSVFDIGGGSTEIIHGSSAPAPRIDNSVSLDVGSVRLFERHIRSDPPHPDELARVREDVARALDSAPAFPTSGMLVGVAGTVTTLAAIAGGFTIHDGALVHGTRLSRGEISRITRKLSSLTLSERLGLAGLDPQRADVIVVGAALVEAILERSRAEEVVVSDRGVRWGLAAEALAEPPPTTTVRSN